MTSSEAQIRLDLDAAAQGAPANGIEALPASDTSGLAVGSLPPETADTHPEGIGDAAGTVGEDAAIVAGLHRIRQARTQRAKVAITATPLPLLEMGPEPSRPRTVSGRRGGVPAKNDETADLRFGGPERRRAADRLLTKDWKLN